MNITDDSETKEKKINPFELGEKLFNDEQLLRNTTLNHDELPFLIVLRLFGHVQDDYRNKYLNIKQPCNLTRLISANLKLRSSIKGWRSEQVVEMLKAGSMNNNFPTTNTESLSSNVMKRLR